jgi:Peptidyl-tRNA hydrolase PTH2
MRCAQVPDEASLRQLSEQLTAGGIDHKLWIEQPENYATCLATKPYARNCIKPHFSSFKLFR